MSARGPLHPACGCKGVRYCLACEPGKAPPVPQPEQIKQFYSCAACNRVYDAASPAAPDGPGPCAACGEYADAEHAGAHIELPGVTVVEDFVGEAEETALVCGMDQWPWRPSQSGRRKQDFGPKVNFKRRKVNGNGFTGLPPASRGLVKRLQRLTLLQDFLPVEQCNLEYCQARGAAIDPHLDDEWVWGERLVTLNLLSGTHLAFSRPQGPIEFEVLVPMPRHSLIVVAGEARHEWFHAIRREHVGERRIAVTFREFGPEFLPAGRLEGVGQRLLDVAATYQGVPIGSAPPSAQPPPEDPS